MEFPLSIVDAFIIEDKCFSGNAAAVCVLNFDDDISDDIKQKIASEMNISETAFVANAWNSDSIQENFKYTLRWFTPTNEVDLCGHATLATARVLFDKHLSQGEDKNNKIRFQTKFKGILEAIIDLEEQTITLDFPLNDCQPIDRETNLWINDIVENTLGPKLNLDLIKDLEYSLATKKLLIRLEDRPESDKIIDKISPNFEKLLEIDTKTLVRGVIVTQKGHNVDFLSRYFAPWYGINEDPVTGSAHTVLTPYWKRQYEKSGRIVDQLIGQQCSKRGGTVLCKIVGQRVLLTGRTRTFLNGIITI